MPLTLSIVPQGFKEAEKALMGLKNGFPRAASDAINRGLIAGRKVAVKRIRERYAIKARDLKGEGMKIKKSRWTQLDGSLNAKGPMLPVVLFSPQVRLKVIKGQKRQVVSVKILKSSRKVVKGAFMARGRVWERRQSDRYPIFPVSTIGVPYMIRRQKISEEVEETIAKATQKNLDHNVQWLLNGKKSS